MCGSRAALLIHWSRGERCIGDAGVRVFGVV